MQGLLEIFAAGKLFQAAPVFGAVFFGGVVRRRLVDLCAHGFEIQFAVAGANVFALFDLNQAAVLFFRLHDLLFYYLCHPERGFCSGKPEQNRSRRIPVTPDSGMTP